MKCIKKGIILDDIFRGTCSICGSKFEATREELDIVFPDHPNAEPPYAYAVSKCPECKSEKNSIMFTKTF